MNLHKKERNIMSEQELLEAGYKKYVGEEIDVFFKRDLCQHACECIKGSSEVFNVNRRPWILPDEAGADELARIIDKCPGRALQYIKK